MKEWVTIIVFFLSAAFGGEVVTRLCKLIGKRLKDRRQSPRLLTFHVRPVAAEMDENIPCVVCGYPQWNGRSGYRGERVEFVAFAEPMHKSGLHAKCWAQNGGPPVKERLSE